MRIALKPGVYCVIPSTIQEKCYGAFVLRAFTEHEIDMRVLDYRPRKKIRIDKIRIEDYATERDMSLMNDCINRISNEKTIYAQTMCDVLARLVSSSFLEGNRKTRLIFLWGFEKRRCFSDQEEITRENCRNYVSMITDNNGPPKISKQDFASYIKLIVFLKVPETCLWLRVSLWRYWCFAEISSELAERGRRRHQSTFNDQLSLGSEVPRGHRDLHASQAGRQGLQSFHEPLLQGIQKGKRSTRGGLQRTPQHRHPAAECHGGRQTCRRWVSGEKTATVCHYGVHDVSLG